MQARLGFLQEKTQQQEASAITHSYRTATTVVDGDAVVAPVMYVPRIIFIGLLLATAEAHAVMFPPLCITHQLGTRFQPSIQSRGMTASNTPRRETMTRYVRNATFSRGLLQFIVFGEVVGAHF